jgi:hypothetical protein
VESLSTRRPDHRTNNDLEGWHRGLAPFYKGKTSHYFKFVQYVQNEQTKTEFEIIHGLELARRSKALKKAVENKLRMKNGCVAGHLTHCYRVSPTRTRSDLLRLFSSF